MPQAPLLEHWYTALRSQTGTVVRITEGTLDQARAKLYKARKEALDERLDKLSLVQSPTGSDEIWIVHSAPGAEKTDAS